MLDPAHPIFQLLQEDQRYTFDAYVFIFEALQYAQDVLHMGAEGPSERPQRPSAEGAGQAEARVSECEERERHVTGQELCEAIRRYALQQYGYMAKTVLNSWGLRNTSDFGEIVFNLIRVGQMRKTPSDTRVDFDNIFDFDVALKQDFKITPPNADAYALCHKRSLLHPSDHAGRSTRLPRLFFPLFQPFAAAPPEGERQASDSCSSKPLVAMPSPAR